jgi:hypothetical protein
VYSSERVMFDVYPSLTYITGLLDLKEDFAPSSHPSRNLTFDDLSFGVRIIN